DSTEAGNVAQGEYRFVKLVTGTYYVCEEPQEGWVQTYPEAGQTSPAVAGTFCHEINLAAGEFELLENFRNFEEAEITVIKDVILADNTDTVEDVTEFTVNLIDEESESELDEGTIADGETPIELVFEVGPGEYSIEEDLN